MVNGKVINAFRGMRLLAFLGGSLAIADGTIITFWKAI
jgi:hypothetical protein